MNELFDPGGFYKVGEFESGMSESFCECLVFFCFDSCVCAKPVFT